MSTLMDVKKEPGLLSPVELIEAIEKLSKALVEDQSSSTVNANRSFSLRTLLDLFDKYNDKLITMKDLE